MAFVFRQQYEPHVEERMREFFETLNEKDQRRFAALEVERLGHGGTQSSRTIQGRIATRDIWAQRRIWAALGGVNEGGKMNPIASYAHGRGMRR
jgi:hypothetical protein